MIEARTRGCLLFLILSCLLALPVAAEVYQCATEDGQTLFQSMPCGETKPAVPEPKPAPPTSAPKPPPQVTEIVESNPPMTVAELEAWLAHHPWPILAFFLAPPLLIWLIGFFHPRRPGRAGLWKYPYAVLIYLATVPGILSTLLVAYAIFFLHQNLLTVNFLVYFLPILSMIATWILVMKAVDPKTIPGVGRLTGLALVLGLTFAIVLFVYKTRIFVGFFGALADLLTLGLIVFALLYWGWRKAFD